MDNICVSGDVDTNAIHNLGAEYMISLPTYTGDINGDVPIKGSLSGLRQFLRTEDPLKLTKNVFYFILKSFFRF